MGKHKHERTSEQDADNKGRGISQKDYQSIKDQLDQEKDKYIRLWAEFENARKRQERDRAEFIKYANEEWLKDFLNIVDDLERTVIAAREKHQDYDSFLKGVEMVMKQVSGLLKKHGVEALDPAGQPFDPYAHEIMMQEPTDEYENGTVIESLQKGYKLGDRVIRTAKVKVALGAAVQNDETHPRRDEEQDS